VSATLIGRVVYRIYHGSQLALGTGFIIRDPRGIWWAYPNEEDVDKDPASAGAMRLDPWHLELKPRHQDPEELPLYIYRVVFNAPPPPRFPPSLLAATKPKPSKSLH
jgi:hypothetical protein